MIEGPADLGIKVYDTPKSNIKLGLDLQGGTRVILKPEKSVSDETFDLIISTINQRLNVFGLSDVIVRKASDLSGNKYVIVEVAGANEEDVAELIEKQGKFEARINNKTLVIAISQSGRTADIIKAVRLAKKQKALVLSITNGADSKLDKIDDITVYNLAGEEKALAATKTFVSQIILLAMLAIFFGQARRKLSSSRRVRIIREITRLPDKMNKILKQNVNIQILANKYYKLENLLILGKNYQYPLSLEAALKFKETTYIHAEGFAAGEFLHGPLAISDKKRPCLFFMPLGSGYEGMKELIKRVKILKRKLIALTSEGNRQLIKYADAAIYIPKTLNLFTPVLAITPIQLLAYYIAVLKGINPDRPRNLKKFVG